MSQFFQIHPVNPQPRLIKRCVEIIQSGGIVVYPTDSGYALGCSMDSKSGLERIRRIRHLDEDHNFTLVCFDLSQISNFARMGNETFRLIKSLTPGPFTFILPATKETPKRLQHAKRKTIGIRLPDFPISQAIVSELGEPLFSSTLLVGAQAESMGDPESIRERLEKEVDLIIDAGFLAYEPTTIVGFADGQPEIVRAGKGVIQSLP